MLPLQQAVAAGDDAAIAAAINAGLDNSTDLLGLITRNTKDSMWVPYEIGGGDGRKLGVAHVVSPDVPLAALPSYVRARLLLDLIDLKKWAKERRKGGPRQFYEARIYPNTEAALGTYLPQARAG